MWFSKVQLLTLHKNFVLVDSRCSSYLQISIHKSLTYNRAVITISFLKLQIHHSHSLKWHKFVSNHKGDKGYLLFCQQVTVPGITTWAHRWLQSKIVSIVAYRATGSIGLTTASHSEYCIVPGNSSHRLGNKHSMYTSCHYKNTTVIFLEWHCFYV